VKIVNVQTTQPAHILKLLDFISRSLNYIKAGTNMPGNEWEGIIIGVTTNELECTVQIFVIGLEKLYGLATLDRYYIARSNCRNLF
jgi:hypothetical protein